MKIRQKKSFNYIKTLLLTTFLLPSLLILGGIFYLFFCLNHQDLEKESRLINIRLLPYDFREIAVYLFANRVKNSADDKKQVLCVFGDSQVFGHRFPSQDVFHNKINKYAKNIKAYNFAIIDGHLIDILRVMKIVESTKLHCNFVAFNLDPAHLKANRNVGYKLPEPHIKHGIAEAAIDILRSKNIVWFGNFISLKKMDFFANKQPQPVGFAMTMKKDYYENLDERTAFFKLDAVINQARKISNHIIIFTSPVHYSEYNKKPYNYNWDPISPQIKLLTFCQKYEGVKCIDWSNYLDKSMFFDLIHLNPRGHQQLGKLVAKEVDNLRIQTT
ncbi:SGNH/GDSL hydrolase family protein [Legionella jamestowniensis]|nr:SGNH/GDSL hydrolase family protein [Legionella jamestowniensis]